MAKYAETLASMNCICCELLSQKQNGRTCIHHIREGQGMAQRAGDFLTLPLCWDCHQGPLGIHGDRTYLKILKMSELDLLNETLKRVWRIAA